jgi:hypothetical protein
MNQLTLLWKILISDLSPEKRNLNFFCIVLKPNWLLLFSLGGTKAPHCIGLKTNATCLSF